MGDQLGDREESRMTCKSYDIPKTLIWEAWLHVKANQGAAGIDAETIERFETKLAAAQALESDEFRQLLSAAGKGSADPEEVVCWASRRYPTGSRRPRSRCGSRHGLIRSSIVTPMAIGRENRRWRRSPSPDAVAGTKTGWWSSTSVGCSTISITAS